MTDSVSRSARLLAALCLVVGVSVVHAADDPTNNTFNTPGYPTTQQQGSRQGQGLGQTGTGSQTEMSGTRSLQN